MREEAAKGFELAASMLTAVWFDEGHVAFEDEGLEPDAVAATLSAVLCLASQLVASLGGHVGGANVVLETIGISAAKAAAHLRGDTDETE